jgi:hypothetical protein
MVLLDSRGGGTYVPDVDEDHLRRLRYESTRWNEWRREHPSERPDLRGAQINWHASKSTLGRTRSVFRQFEDFHLRGVDLHDADLRGAKLSMCKLADADLSGADLRGAEIRLTELTGVNLRGADLRATQFIRCDADRSHWEGAILGDTHFGFTPLRDCQGLDRIVHLGPSIADQFTLVHSTPLPESFYAGCHVPPHVRGLVETHVRQHFYKTCFISYSRRDEPFVQYLREMLTWFGIPSWFAPEDMRDEAHQEDATELERDLFTYIDEAELFIVAMSPHILTSAWVGKELARAWASRPIIMLLIDTMPHPDAEEWKSSITSITPAQKHSHFVPQVYSKQLTELLSRPFIDLRLWRNPASLAAVQPALFAMLLRTTSTP